jgi:formylglycine-generating enzyme required for sulfatase activity
LYTVDGFAIDEGEVSVGAYRRCVDAGACRAPDVGSSFCRELLTGDDRLPQPCVSLAGAEAYCAWAGGRLPTEAEWMRAARGQSTDVFPWGNEFDVSGGPLRGNFGEKPSTGYPAYTTVPEAAPWPADGYRGLSPPCSFPAGRSRFGVCDLEGNLAEWAIAAGTDTERGVVLGGSWLDGEVTAFRLGLRFVLPVVPQAIAHGSMESFLIGFRCVDVPGTASGQ